MNNIIFDMGAIPLGDEMSMSRNLVLDLLHNNYITNDVVIYCKKDRSLLYENIFTNLFFHEDYTEEKIIEKCSQKFKKQFIYIKNIFDIIFWPVDFWCDYDSYQNTLDKEIIITKPNIFNYQKINYYNHLNHSDEFKKLVTNIKYLEVLPKFNNEKYIVYHHRVKNDNHWDQDENILHFVLNYYKNYNIVIFSQANLANLNFDNEKIYVTQDLKEYASFIHNDNCLIIMSIWSGGGQIASYCSSKKTKLIMYFDPVQLQCNDCINNNLDIWINSENAFDFAQFTDVERHFINKNSLKEELEKLEIFYIS